MTQNTFETGLPSSENILLGISILLLIGYIYSTPNWTQSALTCLYECETHLALCFLLYKKNAIIHRLHLWNGTPLSHKGLPFICVWGL